MGSCERWGLVLGGREGAGEGADTVRGFLFLKIEGIYRERKAQNFKISQKEVTSIIKGA